MIAIASQSEFDMADLSDGDLRSAARCALAGSKYVALRKLGCRVFEGVVEITGSVPSFYLKQLAQAAVLQIYPSASIRNLVHVHGESNVLVARSCDAGGATA